MHNDDFEITNNIHKTLNDLYSGNGHFDRIMQKMDHQKKVHKKKSMFFRAVVPSFLSLFLMIGVMFPVFGNESTLVDVYHNYRINRSFRSLHRIKIVQAPPHTQAEMQQFIINTLLERDFNMTPAQIHQLMAQNVDYTEIIGIAIISRLVNQPPGTIIEQIQNQDWLPVLRSNHLPPGRLINEMRRYIQSYEQHPLQTMFFRGIVEHYSGDLGLLMLDGAPFKIHVLPDTILNQPLKAGMVVHVEATFLPDQQKIGAISIQPFDPQKEGFLSFVGKVTFRDRHIIRIYLQDTQKEELLLLSPHILRNPSNRFIRPGAMVRFIAVRDHHGRMIAVRFRPDTGF